VDQPGLLKLRDALTILNNTTKDAPEYPVYLAVGSTPEPLSTFVAAYLQQRLPERRIVVRCGMFGDLTGNLKRALAGGEGPVVLVVEWADLDPRLGIRQAGTWGREVVDDILETVRGALELLAREFERQPSGDTVAVIPPTLPLPPIVPVPGSQVNTLAAGLAVRWAEFVARVVEFERVRVAANAVLPGGGEAGRLDVKAWLQAGFPYRRSYASALAQTIAGLIVRRAPMKGLITDLDNTLWSGILGEVGVGAVAWDLDRHAAAHGIYQRFLETLAGDGIVIGIASKNDPALVEEALKRTDLLIRPQSIFPVEAHWQPKPESAGRILQQWNIGADSVVFLDDSPIEVESMRMAYPTMDCRLFPANDPDALWLLLHDLADLFGKPARRDEDAIRLQSLRAGAGQIRLQESGFSQDQVLESSQGELAITAVTLPPDPRAIELINKTNQFNLNGRRQIESDWFRFLETPGARAWVASYKDKFGPLGKIAVMAGRGSAGGTFDLDVWVMSCRAFSRRIEHAVLKFLFEQQGIEEVILHFEPTERNGPVREFLEDLTGSVPAGPVRIPRASFESREKPLYLTMTSL
jgi:FkbH-like protein